MSDAPGSDPFQNVPPSVAEIGRGQARIEASLRDMAKEGQEFRKEVTERSSGFLTKATLVEALLPLTMRFDAMERRVEQIEAKVNLPLRYAGQVFVGVLTIVLGSAFVAWLVAGR